MVSIPQWCDCCREKEGVGSENTSRFQSHNGAIAALIVGRVIAGIVKVSIPQWCDCCPALLFFVLQIFMFQSHNGAIAARCCHEFRLPFELSVSIPQWCDCCIGQQKKQEALKHVSIPQWCDCCRESFVRCMLLLRSFNPTMVRLLRDDGHP